MPELATQMTKSQMRGYARGYTLGDISEFDGDASTIAFRSPAAAERFGSF